MRILFDIDGVLADIMDSFLEFLHSKTGVMLKKEDVNVYFNWYLKLGVSEERFSQLIQQFYSSPQFNRARLVDKNAPKILGKISKKHELMLLTSRPESTREITEAFITKHYPGIFRQSHFTGSSHIGEAAGTKRELIKKVKADAIVDDDPGLAEEQEGYCLLLYDAPYNKEVKESETVIRVKDFSEIKEAVGKITR